MKTKLLILTLIIPSLIFGQAKRVRDLNEQATRVDTAVLLVDDGAYTGAAKKIKIETLAPKINELSESSITLDKDVYQLRIDNSGTEQRTDLRYINPDITDLGSTTSISTGNYLTIYSSGDKKITYSNVITDLWGEASFISLANTRIAAYVTESFIINLIETEIDAQDLDVGAMTYAVLYAKKIGNSVTITIRDLQNTTQQTVTNYTMTSTFRPLVATSRAVLIGEQDYNFILIYGDGTISIRISDANGVHPSGSYLTTF